MSETTASLEAIAVAAASDPEVMERVKNVAMLVLDEVEEILEDGAPGVKMGVMRSFLPYLIRSLSAGKENDEIAVLKAEMGMLREEIKNAGFPEEKTIRVTVAEDRPMPSVVLPPT